LIPSSKQNPESELKSDGSGASSAVRNVALAIGLGLAGICIRLALIPLVGAGNIRFATHYPIVLASAWLFGFWPSLLTAAICVVFGTFYPYPVNFTQTLIGSFLFLVVSLILAWFAASLRRTQQELRSAQMAASLDARHRSELLESMSDGFIKVDEDWRYQYVNQTAMRYARLAPEKLIGTCLWDSDPHLLGTELERIFRRAMTERVPGKIEFFDEARELWFESRVQPTVDGGLAIYFSEVTERRLTEDRLRAGEAKYRELAEVLPQFIWTRDAAGSIDYCNHELKRFTGLTDEEVMAGRMWDLVHPEDRSLVEAAHQERLAGREFRLECRLRRASDGVYVWHLCRGAYVAGNSGRWIGTAIDIDARKRAEEAVEIADRRLNLVNDSLPVCISYLDSECRYLFVNKTYEQWFGIRNEQQVGMPLAEVVGEKAFARVKPYIDAVLRGEPQQFEAFLPYTRTQPRYVRVLYVPDLAGGTVRGWFALVEDISESRKAEEAARASEHRYSMLAESVPAIVWTSDRSGAVSWSNSQWRTYAGEPTDLAEGWSSYLHPDDREAWKGAWNKAITARAPFELEARLRGADGSYRWFLGRARAVGGETGDASEWLGTLTDIDERKRVESALRESEERLRLAMNAAQLATWDYDLGTGKVTWSENLIAMSGLNQFGQSYDSGMSTVHPDDYPKVEAAVKASLEEGKPYQAEYRVKGTGGEVTWILGKGHVKRDSQGKVERLIGVALNITDRKKAELALRTSEERLRLAQDASGVGIWDWNLETGEVMWSPEIYRFLGYEPEQLQADSEIWMRHIHPDDKLTVDRNLENALAGGGLLELEFRVVRKDGSLRWLLSRGKAIYNEAGKPIRLVGVNMDLTERREVEEALRRTNAELEQYAYAASHDLQEPLRMVMLYTQLINSRHGQELTGEARRYFEFILESATRMQVLIQDLLAYSKLLADHEVRFSTVDMKEVVHSALDACRAAVEESRAEISIGDLPPVHGEHSALVGLMLNLFTNAIKYTRPGDAPVIRVEGRVEGEMCSFSVSDRGIGIRPEYQKRIFGVFKRLHGKEVPGTGIGLALCKRTIEQHGGAIWVESDGENGSTFRFTLPSTAAADQGVAVVA
jgi:PAS domain S-box-containing protein